MQDTKKILITGTSAGFGFDTAKALTERGHTVYATMRAIHGKNKRKAEELRAWAEKNASGLHILELDVTQDASVEQAVKHALALGGIDVLVNNAGFGVMGVQEAFTLDQVESLFATNVFGVLRMNRAVLPHFRSRGKGRIIYISSGLGRLVLPFMGPYTASKFALEALAQTASYELEPLGIRSVVIQPGAFATTFMSNSIQAADTERTEQYGPVLGIMKAFGKGFEDRAKNGQLGDSDEVVKALIKAVEAVDNDLPARLPVGLDVREPVSAINQLSDQIHDNILKKYGFLAS